MESIKPIGRSSDKSTGTFQIQQIRPLERNSKNVQRPQAKVQLDADDMPTPELLIDGRSKLTWLSDRLWRGVTDPLLRSLGTESIKTNSDQSARQKHKSRDCCRVVPRCLVADRGITSHNTICKGAQLIMDTG
ncbi:GMP reductase [Trichinella pseudospiralis]